MTITQLADAIARFENVNPKYNNPGAIWDMSANRIKQFPTYDAGYQALLNTVNAKVGRGYNLYEFMAEYAPSMPGDPIHGTNNPGHYAEVVAGWLGISPGDTLSETLGGSTSMQVPVIPIVNGDSIGDFLGIDTSTLGMPTFSVTGVTGLPDVPWWLYGVGLAAGVYWLTRR